MEKRKCNKCSKTKPLDQFDKLKIVYFRHTCRQCRQERRNELNGTPERREIMREQSAKSYLRNKVQHRICTKAWYEKNKESISIKSKLKYKNNPNRDARNERQRQLYKNNPEVRKYVGANRTKRRLAKRQRIPIWSNLEKIKSIYLKCPKNRVVDHIIPLQGELVSGLHVPENLQYLTPFQNGSKGNQYQP